MPSCAPSAPGLETTGFEIGAKEVAEAMKWPGIIGLGEMMNYPGVINGDPKMLSEMAETMDAIKRLVDIMPLQIEVYHSMRMLLVAHQMIMKVSLRMTQWHALGKVCVPCCVLECLYDVESQITAVTEKGLDPRNFILCTDDSHSGTLVNDGHMNRVVRHAIDCGCDPLVAIQMATINTASHFGMERELGSITPGRRADFIVTSSLKELPIENVFARGKYVAENGKISESYDEKKLKEYMEWDSIEIEVNLKLGNDAFKCFTCDFTHDYIDINADYRN